MSLTDEAVQAIANYRKSVLVNPGDISEEITKLRQALTEIGRRDNNIFYSVSRESFISFPAGEAFDREEYLAFRYLFESSYAIRRVLVREKTSKLVALVPSMLRAHTRLESEYKRKYNEPSFESIAQRAALKAEAQMHGIKSSKDFYVIKTVAESPTEYNAENPIDWLLPRAYKAGLHQQFRTSAKEIALSWGIRERLIDYYIQHIELKKLTEKAAIASAVAGGAVITAWGLSRAIKSQNLMAHQASTGLLTTARNAFPLESTSVNSGLIQPLYGLENLPQYVAPQTTPMIANQAAFLNHLANYGKTNAYDVQLAMIQGANDMANTTLRSIGEIASHNYDYGLTSAIESNLGTTIGAPGNLLGSSTNMIIRNVTPDFATITGTVNGQPISTNIRRIGNAINVTSL